VLCDSVPLAGFNMDPADAARRITKKDQSYRSSAIWLASRAIRLSQLFQELSEAKVRSI